MHHAQEDAFSCMRGARAQVRALAISVFESSWPMGSSMLASCRTPAARRSTFSGFITSLHGSRDHHLRLKQWSKLLPGRRDASNLSHAILVA
jgi:hypothetical protein